MEENNKKDWKNLSQREIKNCIKYRKQTKQYWTRYNKFAYIFYLAIVIPIVIGCCIYNYINGDTIIIIISIIVGIICLFINLNVLSIEHETWYNEHIDELYNNNIIK